MFLAGTPHTAAETLLMLLESSPEPLVSPLEEECLHAENFDKCREIIRILSSPKKNVFIYICLFLQDVLKHSAQNKLDIVKLCKLIILWQFFFFFYNDILKSIINLLYKKNNRFVYTKSAIVFYGVQKCFIKFFSLFMPSLLCKLFIVQFVE